MRSYEILKLNQPGQLDQFKDALLWLAEGEDEDIDYIVENFLNAAKASTGPGAERFLDEARDRFSDNLLFPENISNVVQVFTRGLLHDNKRENEADLILDDVRELVGDNHGGIIVSRSGRILTHLETQLEGLRDSKRTDKATKGWFPFIKSILHTVELRAVRNTEKDFHISSEDYTPGFSTYVPIASVVLLTDDGERFRFQIDADSLDLVIDDLHGLRKDLYLLEEKSTVLKEVEKQ